MSLIHTVYYRSPIGWLKIMATDAALIGLSFATRAAKTSHSNPITERAITQLQEYFAGTRTVFDLPLATAGTPFQQKVWRAIKKIPLGKTNSYTQIAARAGHPHAHRAVGSATGKNPICIIIPCHRVITAAGKLGGFSGPIRIKKLLLKLERAWPKS